MSNQNQTPNGTAPMQAVISKINEVIAQIETELSVAVLDGTPFLLCIEHEGREMVYGDFPFIDSANRKVCFRSKEIVPNHLCGAHLFSRESAERYIVQMESEGHRAWMIHRREFLKQRLDESRTLRATLEAMAAK